MSEESQGFDPYEAVLKDLRAKREQINQAIQLLESLRGGVNVAMPSMSPAGAQSSNNEEGPGAFLGMTIPDAARKLLKIRKRAMGNVEIAQALKAGGLAMQSADPVNTIGSVLTRRFIQVGDVVKISRGTWGLAEWYPNRNFKKKNGGKGDAEEAKEAEDAEAIPVEPTAPEQP